MTRDPIKISYDDLKSDGVEGRLREQSAVRSTKEHYEHANVVAPQIAAVEGWRAWLLKSIVYLALFGLVGGAAGVGAAEMFSGRLDRAEDAAQRMADLRRIDRIEETAHSTADQAAKARANIRERGQRNPEFVRADIAAHGWAAIVETTDTPVMRAAAEADRAEEAHANLVTFALAGFFIAAALASADRLIERDTRGAIVGGLIAGVIGAACGGGIALLLPAADDAIAGYLKNYPSLATTAAFAAALLIFGACIGAVPGLASRNRRRAAAGIGGGALGSILGIGALLVISHFAASDVLARVAAFALVGATAGLMMGWLEEAAKQGWLRVASGLIAGKQFILYRNPTFVGSAPMSHIYLFRDPQVGRRHAAIFQVTGGGYEIENLPLGGPTLLNGQPVTRSRLRRGDRIGIGRTTLVFDEKVAS